MKLSKRKKLEAAGFKVGSVQEFLHLSDKEMALIDFKLSRAVHGNARLSRTRSNGRAV